jgi:hypothetical protein
MGRPDEVEPVFERIRARGVVRFDRKAGRRRAGGRCNVDGDGGFGEILPEDGSKEGRVVGPIRGDSQREASDEVRTVDGIPRLQGDRNVHPTMAARFDVFRPDQKGGVTESSAEVSIDRAARKRRGCSLFARPRKR